MSEQRRATRNRTFLPARIEIAELGLVSACTIRDLSDTGARIQVSGSVPLPPTFTLHIPRFDRRVRATQAWKNGDTIGVRFEVEVKEVTPATYDARYVKKLEDEISRLKLLLESIRADPMKARLLLDEAV